MALLYMSFIALVLMLAVMERASTLTSGSLRPDGNFCLPPSAWSQCSVSCGEGIQTKTRTCKDVSACPLDNPYSVLTDTITCNPGACPTWGIYGPWSDCLTRCGESGSISRTRICTNPDNLIDGCDGDEVEVMPCVGGPDADDVCSGMRTTDGCCCVFPFQIPVDEGYHTVQQCTTFQSEQPWCATTSNFPSDGLYGICETDACETIRTHLGDCCVFPFIYNGIQRSECVPYPIGTGRTFCGLTSNYDRDLQFGFCPPGTYDCDFATSFCNWTNVGDDNFIRIDPTTTPRPDFAPPNDCGGDGGFAYAPQTALTAVSPYALLSPEMTPTTSGDRCFQLCLFMNGSTSGRLDFTTAVSEGRNRYIYGDIQRITAQQASSWLPISVTFSSAEDHHMRVRAVPNAVDSPMYVDSFRVSEGPCANPTIVN